MGYYIAILLMVLPGFAAKSTYTKLNHSQKTDSEFRETIKSLGINVPITLLNLIYIFAFGLINGSEINDFAALFNFVPFIIFYTCITATNAMSVALLVDLFTPAYYQLINIIRRAKGKNVLLNTPSLSGCLCDGQKHLIAIEKSGVIIEPPGVLEKIDVDEGGVSQISLIGQEDLKDIDFSKVKVKQRYYNFFQDDRAVVEFDKGELEKTNDKNWVVESVILLFLFLLPIGFGFAFKLLF